MSRIERRRYYRLRYPEGQRPDVYIDGQPLPLAELSERGIRFIEDAEAGRAAGTICWVRLDLATSKPIHLEGAVVLRYDGQHCVLGLGEDCIEPEVIFGEQRRLIRRAKKQGDVELMSAMRVMRSDD